MQTVCFRKPDGSIIEFRKFNPYHDRLGRFASADGAGISRSMVGFVRSGRFDLAAAKADYRKFLQSVPEKNRIYLEQALKTVGFREVDLPDVVFGYSEKRDAILYNPQNPAFAAYDSRVALTHELAHRIDHYFVHSSEQAEFGKTIQKAKALFERNPEQWVEFCKKNDEEGFLSDIMSAICRDEYEFAVGHPASYWNPKTQVQETFANLFALETYEDGEKLAMLRTSFPELMKAFESLEFNI